MEQHDYKAECVAALYNFIAEPSNEHKLALYLAYESVDEAEAAQYLGPVLDAAMHRILRENAHDDDYLLSLKTLLAE